MPVTFSTQITANTINVPYDIFNPAPYASNISLVTVTSTGALSCSVYPQINLVITRGTTNSYFGYMTLSAGTQWQESSSLEEIEPGDVVAAELAVAGVGCTNELPLTVTLTLPYGVAVSANLSQLTGAPSATNAFMRMKLSNCGTNNPHPAEIGRKHRRRYPLHDSRNRRLRSLCDLVDSGKKCHTHNVYRIGHGPPGEIELLSSLLAA